MSIFSTVAKVVGDALQTQQKIRVLQLFQNMNDRDLADIGISRELLNQGVKAYPWRVDEAPAGARTPEAARTTAPSSPGAHGHLAV
ncbi:MAG: DUF1127 domain-containing protein [Thiothrix sp.]|nr:DUF1127 domain-containing protein [Thiothrix sp.]HPQ95533.1 hypothetical protein [Thiolinea sp.]